MFKLNIDYWRMGRRAMIIGFSIVLLCIYSTPNDRQMIKRILKEKTDSLASKTDTVVIHTGELPPDKKIIVVCKKTVIIVINN